jgi:7-carboxy-7-deazaguanine synthase
MPAESTGSGSPRLKITEVFRSLQGEANSVGFPTTFIRLTGCPLRCQYCDTAYAFQGGEWRTIDDLLQAAQREGTRHVCVTGGEPLAQKNCLSLLTSLCDAGFEVSLETSGALPIEEVDSRVARVVDVKTPGSLESARNRLENLTGLRPHDQVKFVICDRMDYEWSRDQVQQLGITARCTVLFSPSAEQLPARDLANWILEDRLPVRFQLQLHKILWGNVAGK